MKKGKVLKVFLLAFCCAVSFVSCSNDVSEKLADASISFTTSVSKALNQGGIADESLSEKVEDYYWKYYCDTVAPSRDSDNSYDSLDWNLFDNLNGGKGLGTVPKLIKGEYYYFGLRGYADAACTNLIWEGFHFESGKEGSTSTSYESVKLTSKNQLVTIDVYSAGVGKLYFNIYAPCSGFDVESSNNKDENDVVKYDHFVYKLDLLDSTEFVTPTDLNVTFSGTAANDTDKKYGYYNGDKESGEFWYSDLGGSGTELTSGTYLMTVWQVAWNKNEDGTGEYKEVNQRKQVLIVNIVPGVSTVISGSLDSTALDTFNFNEDGQDLKVIFHPIDASNVKPLDVTVIDDKSQAVSYTSPSNIIEVGNFNGKYNRPLTNDFIEIKPVEEDIDLMIYINGIEVNKDSAKSSETLNVAQYKLTEDDFLVRTRKGAEETTYVQLLQDDNGQYYVRAFGKLDYQYILTIRKSTNPQESVSFTITGKTASERDNVAVTGIKLKTTETSIAIGESVQLREVVLPENATNDNVTWSSSDETIATVDENGVVTATGNGVATITATTTESSFEATATVKVLNYLTFSSSSAFTLGTANIHAEGLEVSTDKSTWTAFKEVNAVQPSVSAVKSGDKYYVYIRGDNMTSLSSFGDFTIFELSGKKGTVDCSGDIMSLLDWDNPDVEMTDYAFDQLFSECTALKSAPELPATELAKYCYAGMFYDCDGLTTASELPATDLTDCDMCYAGMFYDCDSLITVNDLPATKLSSKCYYQMFYECDGLTTAPDILATTLANECCKQMFYGCDKLTTAGALSATDLTGGDYCYYQMFQSCKKLTTVPTLPATKLAPYCYEFMFEYCTSLTTAPELPATDLTGGTCCYYHMFYGCTGLTTAPALPATTLADYCYEGMFIGCTSLTTAPALPATTLTQYCYYGMFEGCTSLTTLQIPEGKTQVLPAESVNALKCYDGMFYDCTSLNVTADSTQSGAVTIFTCPNASNTDLSNLVQNMFTGTAGDAPDTPVANTTYYFY